MTLCSIPPWSSSQTITSETEMENQTETTTDTAQEAGQKQTREYVYWMDELFGFYLTDEEYENLTADQLREAISNYDRVVIGQPNGGYNVIDAESHEYAIVEFPEGEAPLILPEE